MRISSLVVWILIAGLAIATTGSALRVHSFEEFQENRLHSKMGAWSCYSNEYNNQKNIPAIVGHDDLNIEFVECVNRYSTHPINEDRDFDKTIDYLNNL